MRQWDEPLGDLLARRDAVARELARTVRRGRYRLGPVRAERVVFADKPRVLHRFGWIDHAVLAVLARGLSRLAEPELSTGLHSYRRGHSVGTAIAQLTDFIAAHRRSRNKRDRGLYVVRRDVRAYGESIPTEPASHLWNAFASVLARLPAGQRAIALDLLQQALRPTIEATDGTLVTMTCGTPTGSPLQPLVNNLYLARLDHTLGAQPDGLFVRFGDDMLLAHPDADVAQHMAQLLRTQLQVLGLSPSEAKRGDLYVTHCGRPSAAWPAARGGSCIEYLGLRVDFGGTVALKPRRVRTLLADLRHRWDNTEAAASGLALPQRRALLCGVTSRALDPRVRLASAMAPALVAVVSDRAQLKQLDYTIALALAERLSGRRGVRAFRDVSHRSLRDAGLASLVVARNGHPVRNPRERTAEG